MRLEFGRGWVFGGKHLLHFVLFYIQVHPFFTHTHFLVTLFMIYHTRSFVRSFVRVRHGTRYTVVYGTYKKSNVHCKNDLQMSCRPHMITYDVSMSVPLVSTSDSDSDSGSDYVLALDTPVCECRLHVLFMQQLRTTLGIACEQETTEATQRWILRVLGASLRQLPKTFNVKNVEWKLGIDENPTCSAFQTVLNGKEEVTAKIKTMLSNGGDCESVPFQTLCAELEVWDERGNDPVCQAEKLEHDKVALLGGFVDYLNSGAAFFEKFRNMFQKVLPFEENWTDLPVAARWDALLADANAGCLTYKFCKRVANGTLRLGYIVSDAVPLEQLVQQTAFNPIALYTDELAAILYAAAKASFPSLTAAPSIAAKRVERVACADCGECMDLECGECVGVGLTVQQFSAWYDGLVASNQKQLRELILLVVSKKPNPRAFKETYGFVRTTFGLKKELAFLPVSKAKAKVETAKQNKQKHDDMPKNPKASVDERKEISEQTTKNQTEIDVAMTEYELQRASPYTEEQFERHTQWLNDHPGVADIFEAVDTNTTKSTTPESAPHS
jgi:hypothetical protein